MKIWFLEDLKRLQYERDQIDRLLSTADWLQSASWSFIEGQLVVNAALRVHDNRVAAAVTTLAGTVALAAAYGAENYTLNTANKSGIIDPVADT